MKNILIIIIVLFLISLMVYKRDTIKSLVSKFKIRGTDKKGSGKFGASRSGRVHKGLDIVTKKGEEIFAPFDLKFIRIANPYKNDKKFTGGLFEDDKFKLKIFYMKPNKGTFKKGEVIGYSQDISEKYSGITPHIHLELRDKDNKILDPSKYLT